MSTFLVLVAGVWATAEAPSPSPLGAESADAASSPRVIVIGVDAASLNIMRPLAAANLIPNLSKLMKSGATGDFASIWPLRTPQVWTSIVTGKYPGQHGIWDHYSSTKYNPPAVRTLAKRRLTTRHRRSKALWNILDAGGVRVMTVGWIASWPAEQSANSVMIAPPVLTGSRQVSIKGTFWKDAKRQVWPTRLEARVVQRIVEGPSLTPADLTDFADVPEKGHPILKVPHIKKYMRALRWSVARARSVEGIILEVLPDAQPDLLMFYFQCSDSLFHRFYVFEKSVEEVVERFNTHGISTAHVEELRRRFGRVPTACYQDIDRRVGRILERARGDNTLVMIISDHGFGEAPLPHPKKTEPYGGNHLDAGVIIAAAPWIPAGAKLEGASIFDITPTLLHFFDQPVADDMTGAVLPLLLDPAAKTREVRKIRSYERRPQLKIPHQEGWPARHSRPLAEDS